MDTNYKNQHEPTFNRNLVVGERSVGIKMSNTRARVHSVFGSIIREQGAVGARKPVTRPVREVSRTDVVSNHVNIERSAMHSAAQITVPQQPKTRHYLDIMPTRSAVHSAAPRVAFRPVNQDRPVRHVASTAPKGAPIVTAPKIVIAPKGKVTDLSKPLTLAEALANIDTNTNYNLFAPNSVDPAAAKMTEKESMFDKLKKFIGKGQKAKRLHKKVVARKEISAKHKAEKLAILAKQRETRAHLLREDEINTKFANSLSVAAETATESTFAGQPTPTLRVSASNHAAMSTNANRKQDHPAQHSPAISFGGGAIAIDTSALRNPFANLSAARVSFVMPKINARKILSVLRVVAILVVLTVSGYLAWDTWVSGHAAQTFNAAAGAMSIASVDPNTADPTAVSSQQYSAYTTPADEPRYIAIPSINVNARIQKVGVTSSGNIDVSKKLADTAWYDGSAKPGQPGQVFIDGHTSFSSATAASFNDLTKLTEGSLITVQTGSGAVYNYKVAKTETVPTAKVNMQQALNTYNGADRGLTLMTCAGEYDYKVGDATERYIVYAVQE